MTTIFTPVRHREVYSTTSIEFPAESTIEDVVISSTIKDLATNHLGLEDYDIQSSPIRPRDASLADFVGKGGVFSISNPVPDPTRAIISCMAKLRAEVESLKRGMEDMKTGRERVLRTIEIPLVYRLLINTAARKLEPTMKNISSRRLEVLLKSPRLSLQTKTFLQENQRTLYTESAAAAHKRSFREIYNMVSTVKEADSKRVLIELCDIATDCEFPDLATREGTLCD